MKKVLFTGLAFLFLIAEKAAAQVSFGPTFGFSSTTFEAYGPVETLVKKRFSGTASLQFSSKRHRFLTGLRFEKSQGDWGRTGRWPSQHSQTNPGTWDPNLMGESVIRTDIGLFAPVVYRFVLAKKGRVLPFLEAGGAVGAIKTRYGSGGSFQKMKTWQGNARAGFGLEILALGGRFQFFAGGQKIGNLQQRNAVFNPTDEWSETTSPVFEAGWLFDWKPKKEH